jgi:hypothetical protein
MFTQAGALIARSDHPVEKMVDSAPGNRTPVAPPERRSVAPYRRSRSRTPAILGVIGVAFAAAGVRVTFSLPATLGHRRAQVTLILALLLLFGLQILFGIVLLIRPDGVGALADIGYVLVASLLIGIGRAWELVGAWAQDSLPLSVSFSASNPLKDK